MTDCPALRQGLLRPNENAWLRRAGVLARKVQGQTMRRLPWVVPGLIAPVARGASVGMNERDARDMAAYLATLR